MANTIKSYIIIRNDTIENWTANNTVLKKGELALSFENGAFSLKAGNGIDPWKNLPFIAIHSTDISDLENAIANSNVITELSNKVDETTIGSITQDEKNKIQSFTIEDVTKWKNGFDEFQNIKQKINIIKTENPLIDSTTVGTVVNVLNKVMEVFKVINEE